MSGDPRAPDPFPVLSPDRLREVLDLLPRVVASVAERVDAQADTLHAHTEALDRLEAALQKPNALSQSVAEAADLVVRIHDKADRAFAQASGQTSRMGEQIDRADRLVQKLRDATYQSDHLARDTLEAAREWRVNARRLTLWTAPALLLLLLVLTFTTALLAPRALTYSETLCALAGASWVADQDSDRTGCWMETRQ